MQKFSLEADYLGEFYDGVQYDFDEEFKLIFMIDTPFKPFSTMLTNARSYAQLTLIWPT